MIWCLVSTIAISQSAMPMKWEMNGQPLTFRVITIINSSCLKCHKPNIFNTFCTHNNIHFTLTHNLISERANCVIVKYFEVLFFLSHFNQKICWCKNKTTKKHIQMVFNLFVWLYFSKNFYCICVQFIHFNIGSGFSCWAFCLFVCLAVKVLRSTCCYYRCSCNWLFWIEWILDSVV